MKKVVKSLLRPYWHLFKNIAKSGLRLAVVPIRNLPISSETLGPPKGFYKSTQEWMQAKGKSSGAQYFSFRPEETAIRVPPHSLESTVHWKMKEEYKRDLPASFVATIPNGRFCINKGAVVDNTAVITADDMLLADLSSEFGEFGEKPEKHSIFTRWKLPQAHYLPGTVAILTSVKADIYFHWMFDLLPKTEILRQSGFALHKIDWFVVNSLQMPFQKSSLQALGIPAEKVIESIKYSHIKADTLLVPSLACIPGNVPMWVSDFIRKTFLTEIKSAVSGTTPKRVYISRGDAKYRRVEGESQLIKELSGVGFEPVELSKLSLQGQIDLFVNAEAIVAPHGAGLTNLIYCEPETVVIEFFSPNYVNACYYALSSQLKLNYYYLIGEGNRPAEGTDPHLAGDDITIKPEYLLQIMARAGLMKEKAGV
jgi:capsular polysaccharide biosynthesis protein